MNNSNNLYDYKKNDNLYLDHTKKTHHIFSKSNSMIESNYFRDYDGLQSNNNININHNSINNNHFSTI